MKLKLEEECKECHGQLLASQLRKAIERNLPNILCTFCGKKIDQPSLTVVIGKNVNRNRNKFNNFTEIMTKFISAEVLFDGVKEELEKTDF